MTERRPREFWIIEIWKEFNDGGKILVGYHCFDSGPIKGSVHVREVIDEEPDSVDMVHSLGSKLEQTLIALEKSQSNLADMRSLAASLAKVIEDECEHMLEKFCNSGECVKCKALAEAAKYLDPANDTDPNKKY